MFIYGCEKETGKNKNENVPPIGQPYQGGVVAYIFKPFDPGYVSGETHGLIAAPTDQSSDAEWGCDNIKITGADATALTSGMLNTLDIIAGCSTQGTAARLCYDLELGGYSDWYLPSKDELDILALYQNEIGGFEKEVYWSSTEVFNKQAVAEWFANGNKSNWDKYIKYNVRAVRAF